MFDRVCKLFSETIRKIFGCDCYFVVDCYGGVKCEWRLLLLLFAFQSMFISVWVSRLEIVEFPDDVCRSVP